MRMEMRNEKWKMRNDIIMASYIKNLLKQLPFYGNTIKPRIKKFTDTKLLSELPVFWKTLKSQN